MAKYHINPEKGPMRCTAAAGQCPYGTDAPHYSSKKEAQGKYEESLEKEIKPLTSLKKPPAPVKAIEREHTVASRFIMREPFTTELVVLEEKLEELDFEELQAFASESPEAHANLMRLVEARGATTPGRQELLRDLNPHNKDAKNPISNDNYKKLKTALEIYKNQTAMMVEVYHDSPFYRSRSKKLDPSAPVGSAVPASQFAHSDHGWHLSRFDTIGGSDVGALVLKDHVPEELLGGFDKLYIKKVEKSKVVPPTAEDAQKSIQLSELSKRGPLYRGSVWENKIRDDFAKQHPELTVYDTSGQYMVPGRDWHRVNFDGVLSDRPDGRPNGILEIKTGNDPRKWEEEIPPAYRAQTLYYLAATEFDFAQVRVLLSDGEYRDYHLFASDEVYPGAGIAMKDYIDQRVLPWFEELKSQREAA